jgi:hypothetical protein
MNKSDNIGALAKALCIVQGKLKPAIKEAINPHFKKSYADLNSVWDSCRELLSVNGLSIAQLNQVAENGVIVETVLMHESGEWISGEVYLPLAKQDPQGVGSAITYGRRYGLASIVGIVSDEDDDARAASPRNAQQSYSQNVKQMPYKNDVKSAQATNNAWACGAQLQREILDLEAALDSAGIGSTIVRDKLEENFNTRNPATLNTEQAQRYRDYLSKKNDATEKRTA